MLRFTIELTTTPATGNELADLIRQAAEMVRFNMGPEPVRASTGPVYDGPAERPAAGQRCGTWSIKDEQPRSELLDMVGLAGKLAFGPNGRHAEKRSLAEIEAGEIRQADKERR